MCIAARDKFIKYCNSQEYAAFSATAFELVERYLNSNNNVLEFCSLL